ncbi:MAG: peptide/nickel transport system permease protein, partial [Gammaproteobacteria bacterium]|nr:peptide/nickel transport system permease protein [Gammaproteobacteria bacterium]
MTSGRPPALTLGAVAAVSLIVLAVLLAPWIAPYAEQDFTGGVWEPISAAHWLGTDNLGRDLFTRLVYGG